MISKYCLDIIKKIEVQCCTNTCIIILSTHDNVTIADLNVYQHNCISSCIFIITL